MSEIEPGMQAQLDQAEAGSKPMAALMGIYRDALLDAGFKRDEALALVLQYHAHTWAAQLKASP
jgi:hypothetical protein